MEMAQVSQSLPFRFFNCQLIVYLAKCFPLATRTPGLCFVFLLERNQLECEGYLKNISQPEAHMIQLILQPFLGLS